MAKWISLYEYIFQNGNNNVGIYLKEKNNSSMKSFTWNIKTIKYKLVKKVIGYFFKDISYNNKLIVLLKLSYIMFSFSLINIEKPFSFP